MKSKCLEFFDDFFKSLTYNSALLNVIGIGSHTSYKDLHLFFLLSMEFLTIQVLLVALHLEFYTFYMLYF